MGSGQVGGCKICCAYSIAHSFSQTNPHKKTTFSTLSLSHISKKDTFFFPKKVKYPWLPYKRCYGKGLRSRTKRVDQGLEWVTHAMLLVISFMFLGAMTLIGTSPIVYSSLILVGLFVIFLQNSRSCLTLLV